MAKTKVQHQSGTNGDSPDVAYVTPALITWALRRSRMTEKAVAQKLKVDESLIAEWQRPGGSHPAFPKAQALAKLLHVPFGFFYLKEPPAVDLPLPDFRGFDRAYRPSSDLLELLNETLVRQDWYREHEKESGSPPLKFVGSFSVRDSVENVADAIRVRLGITVKARESASTHSEYLSLLSRRAEDCGILVMRSGVVGNISTRPLKPSELLGFAITDQYAPIVFVNSADYRTSQVFTFAHELAHLWIGEDALANPDELEVPERNKVEAFCNRVAAELLVPQREFVNEWGSMRQSNEMKLSRVSKRFWVSGLVALRRAHELEMIDDEQFESLKRPMFAQRKKDQFSGGNYYRNISVRMSPRFTEAVVRDVNTGKLELRDAAGLLSMKVPTLIKFAEKSK